MRTDEFDFDLPERLIAQHPAARRGVSRLLHVRGDSLADLGFADLPALVRPNDVLVLNDTRVIKARLYGEKISGGRVEVLVERVLGDRHALAQVRASKALREGGRIIFPGGAQAVMMAREGEFYRLRFEGALDVDELLERHGHLPLPPYITHAATEADETRYQTVYAKRPGAVAAPTAGLHFDEVMLDSLRGKGAQIAHVTLHVGAGTFKPVRAETVHEHVMHSERYEVPEATVQAIRAARAQGGRVIAVGTTSLRALESAALAGGDGEDMKGELAAGERETNIFIFPGYRFRVVDVLLTNFHLPRSTLLMLVCAFGGMREVLAAYRHAVAKEYRFFSYGDAMLLERRE